jgi:hypothetical protein
MGKGTGYIYGCSIPVIKLHRLNMSVNQTDYINKVLLVQYPWETVATIAAAQTARGQQFTGEVL